MTKDDFDKLPPDPLLAGSDGDEAPKLGNKPKYRGWLGVATGVGVGSAAIAAAMMFWGKKEPAPKPEAPATKRSREKPKAVSGASDSSAD